MIFIKLDGIPGDSTVAGFKDWISIASFSWGSARGRSLRDLHVVKEADGSSPALVSAACGTEAIGEATLVVTRNGDKLLDFYKLRMFDVQVASVQTSSSGDQPIETISFRFRSSELQLRGQSPTGAVGPWSEPVACTPGGPRED